MAGNRNPKLRFAIPAIFLAGVLYGCNQATDAGSNSAIKRVFITTLGYTGNLGGLSGADAKCANHAAAGALGGTWKAWISDATTDAIDRIADVGPWYLIDRSTRIFNSKANLTTQPIARITMDENGIQGGNAVVWTGTMTGGTKAPYTCDSWTSISTYGRNGETLISSWTSANDQGCNLAMRLYCIEQ